MTQHVVMTVTRMTLRDDNLRLMTLQRGLFAYDEGVYCKEDVVEDDIFFSGEILLRHASQETHGSELFFF